MITKNVIRINNKMETTKRTIEIQVFDLTSIEKEVIEDIICDLEDVNSRDIDLREGTAEFLNRIKDL